MNPLRRRPDLPMKILLVEDDARVASFIRRGLKEESYTVDLADRKKKWEVGSLRSWPPAGVEASMLETTRWATLGTKIPASYADGEWNVVLKRPRPAGENSAPLIGFMVWDGGNQEQGRHRASSQWLDLVLTVPGLRPGTDLEKEIPR